MRPYLLLSLLSVVGWLLPSSDACAQEVGISFATANSEHPEFPGPLGFSAFALMEVGSAWLVQLSFHRIADETDKEGVVCSSYLMRIGCNPQETHSSMALSGLRGGLLRVVRAGEWLRLGIGGGLSFNHVDGSSRGTSGLRADLLVPNGGQIGTFGTLSVAVAPLPSIPARILGRFNAHWVRFNACSGEDPPQPDPFCHPGTFRELEIGVSYAF